MRFLLLLLTAACSQVPPATAIRLAALDPLSADPGAIEIAVVPPEGMDAQPGTAVLTLQVAMGEDRRDGNYRLIEQAVPAGLPLAEGAHARSFRLSPADAAAMRALQAEALAWKDGGGTGSATIGAALAGCRQGEGPQPGAEGAVLVRVGEDAEFLPLIGPAPLSALVGARTMDGLLPCSGVR